MDELKEFISILDAECDVLKKSGLMLDTYAQPWRYYSCPLDDEHEYELLRSVIEAGKHTVKAEELVIAGDETGAWQALAEAQRALLKSLSTHGKAKAKKNGQVKGGQSKSNEVHDEILCIADELLEAGHAWRGLARKVVDQLSSRGEGYSKTESQVRDIINKEKDQLDNS